MVHFPLLINRCTIEISDFPISKLPFRENCLSFAMFDDTRGKPSQYISSLDERKYQISIHDGQSVWASLTPKMYRLSQAADFSSLHISRNLKLIYMTPPDP